ncbi:hypothetical protein DXG01_012072 [Tephrocybe rancida]|nr:hypothetical protein DXG01_012072 [Tephrocybe rancida]
MFISLVGTSLGAILIGCVIAATIYGCTCYQMFSYWQNSRDSPRFRALITVVWLLDTIHMVFIAHAVYHYAVKNFGNPAALEESVWSVLAQVYLATWSDSIVRATVSTAVGFGYVRPLKISLALEFTTLSNSEWEESSVSRLYCCHGRIYSRLMTMHTPEAAKNVFYIYITFGGLIACDVLIAGSLCIALSKHRSVFRSTNSLINIFILYTVNTSLLTTVCAIASLITAVVWPKNMVYLALIFNLSKRKDNLSRIALPSPVTKHRIQYT